VQARKKKQSVPALRRAGTEEEAICSGTSAYGHGRSTAPLVLLRNDQTPINQTPKIKTATKTKDIANDAGNAPNNIGKAAACE
jgi:hypothetical protein